MSNNYLGPYKYQRLRHRLGEYPRQPQPGFQPNQKPPLIGWGMSNESYWREVFSDYLKRRGRNLGGLK